MSEDEIQEPDNTDAIEALAVFCDKYEPVSETRPFTDFFSSPEILHILSSHTGYSFRTMELHKMLKDMGYKYRLEGTEFIWECHKVTNE